MSHAPRPTWLTEPAYEALSQLLGAFALLGVPYQATGGLAGNLHGSQWPLHDLDFDIASDAMPRVAAHFHQQVLFGPAPYRDEEFAVDMLTIRLGALTADLCAAESIRVVTPEGLVVPAPSDLQRSVQRRLRDRILPTMPLAELIAYKRLIGRNADVADLERLASLDG